MNQHHDQNPWDSIEPPFVRPPAARQAEEEADELSEPLAPFFGGLHDLDGHTESAAPTPGVPVVEDGNVDSDSSWLVREDRDTTGPAVKPTRLDSPSYLGGVPEVDLDADTGVVAIESLQPDPGPDSPEPQTQHVALGESAEPAEAARPEAGGWHAFEGTAIGSGDMAGELNVEQAGGFRELGSSLSDEVAARLERIARSLRTHGPAELLSGSSDPLEVLIVGYVLGAASARERGGPAGADAEF